ncbi:hypothetical protein JTE90_023615 [Oedothorax gibbosus]|uniref:GAG-pre-integrase domain-containing protein n=1 Tax=Oedothorax gibbosus TaxID=931172 RepID=A0AAV6U080_9ARAC|nr:hypothetical protein JTE90_023615 [Oedothorax gibbosus]
MLRAERRRNLHFIEPIEERAAVVKSGIKFEIRHQKFGYLNVNDLKKLESQNMVRGLTFRNNNDSLKDCKICIQSKQSAKPYLKKDQGRSRYYEPTTALNTWVKISTNS